MKTRSGWVSGVLVAFGVVSSDPGEATACGGFFRARAAAEKRLPSLAHERALIVYDEATLREHFVRTVVFRESREPFGFVVPTPSRPEVASVEKDPFPELEAHFPFRARKGALVGGPRSGGAGRSRAPGKVEVLEVKKVGSFTAFVLAANDASALQDWLEKNQFVSTPETDAWLAHYVRLGFHYVAMRYEPPREASGRTTSQVMRLSFDAPAPYYPYLEPTRAGADANEPRLLEVWMVSTRLWEPVAARRENNTWSWVRPFVAGASYEHSFRREVVGAIGSRLLPAGDTFVVQSFADQKRSRNGFGDAVFVPKDGTGPRAVPEAALAPFLPIVDPSLGEGQ